jgi:hypothetical protein
LLKALKVEMLLLSAIPTLVDTWTSAFGFRPIDDFDKKRLSKIRLASVPGTVLLKKALYECSETATGELPHSKPFKTYSCQSKSDATLNILYANEMAAGDGTEYLSCDHQSSATAATDRPVGTPFVAGSEQQQPVEDTGLLRAKENNFVHELGGLMIGPQCVGPPSAVALGKRPAN